MCNILEFLAKICLWHEHIYVWIYASARTHVYFITESKMKWIKESEPHIKKKSYVRVWVQAAAIWFNKINMFAKKKNEKRKKKHLERFTNTQRKIKKKMARLNDIYKTLFVVVSSISVRISKCNRNRHRRREPGHLAIRFLFPEEKYYENSSQQSGFPSCHGCFNFTADSEETKEKKREKRKKAANNFSNSYSLQYFVWFIATEMYENVLHFYLCNAYKSKHVKVFSAFFFFDRVFEKIVCVHMESLRYLKHEARTNARILFHSFECIVSDTHKWLASTMNKNSTPFTYHVQSQIMNRSRSTRSTHTHTQHTRY